MLVSRLYLDHVALREQLAASFFFVIGCQVIEVIQHLSGVQDLDNSREFLSEIENFRYRVIAGFGSLNHRIGSIVRILVEVSVSKPIAIAVE